MYYVQNFQNKLDSITPILVLCQMARWKAESEIPRPTLNPGKVLKHHLDLSKWGILLPPTVTLKEVEFTTGLGALCGTHVPDVAGLRKLAGSPDLMTATGS